MRNFLNLSKFTKLPGCLFGVFFVSDDSYTRIESLL